MSQMMYFGAPGVRLYTGLGRLLRALPLDLVSVTKLVFATLDSALQAYVSLSLG